MVPQLLDVVDPLLPDEDGSAFETNLAESFLVIALHVLSQAVNVGKGMLRVAVLDQTRQVTKPHSFSLSLCIFIIDRVVFLICDASPPQLVVKLMPRQLFVLRYDNLFALLFANGALVVAQNETNSEYTARTDILVTALTHGKEPDWIETQNAIVLFQVRL